MSSVKILVDSDDAARDFSRRIAKYDCEFDLQVGQEYMDARSMAARYSLSLKEPVTLHIYAEDEMVEEVKEDIGMYCVS
ncbi:MAG: HPr family phosphocarrier protein [Lachnospiraceae bacterium]